MTVEKEYVKYIASQLVQVYTKHIDERITELDESYIELGVDKTFAQYLNLFKRVFSKVLGVNSGVSTDYITQTIVSECVNIVVDRAMELNLMDILDDQANALCVHEVCILILDRVKRDNFKNEYGYITNADISKTRLVTLDMNIRQPEMAN